MNLRFMSGLYLIEIACFSFHLERLTSLPQLSKLYNPGEHVKLPGEVRSTYKVQLRTTPLNSAHPKGTVS